MDTSNNNHSNVKNILDCTVCETGTYQTVGENSLCPNCQGPDGDRGVPVVLRDRHPVAEDVKNRFLELADEIGDWHSWMVYTASPSELVPLREFCEVYDVAETTGNVCFTTAIVPVVSDRYLLGICAQRKYEGLYDRYVDLKTEIRGDPHDAGWSK